MGQSSKLFSNEDMVYYAQCCCCFKSKTGAKIISILGLIFSSLSIIGNVIGLATNHQAWIVKFGLPLAQSVQTVTLEVIYLGYALITIGQIAYLAMFAMLFHGIKKERHGFMLPFLVFDMISLVISTIWIGIGIAMGIYAMILVRQFVFLIVLSMILQLLFLAFGYYLWDVIKSVYQDIKQSNEEASVVMPMTQYGEKEAV